jgi:hypothetical protein
MKSILIIALLIASFSVQAQKTSEELAKSLQNPLANLISVPFQQNMEYGIGTRNPEGSRSITNIQPVIPVHVTTDWLIINRIITPIISQTNTPGVPGTQNGVGDILYSAFLSPAQSAITWGVGPALSLPTGTDNFLSKRKWSLGPTFVALKQKGPWTFGALSNQLWSIAGDSEREEVDQFFFQPFVSYTLPSSLTFAASMEDTYDWKTDKWVWSFIPTISKVFKPSKVPFNLAIGPKFFGGDEETRPEIGFRASITFMFPEK